VRYFASLAELAGCRDERVEIGPGTDVAALWRVLGERHPALARLAYRPLAACDLTYVSWDTPLDGVGEVAFLPPVSGG
jgi:molybdopterin converting factor small subunit